MSNGEAGSFSVIILINQVQIRDDERKEFNDFDDLLKGMINDW